MLSKIVAPRVHAAAFKTLWNGWTSERRFQRRRGHNNRCRFRCSESAEDSIEHYCRCGVIIEVARSYFNMHYPAEEALNIWALNTHWVDRQEVMTCVALLIYGAFNAFNSIAHHGISSKAQAHKCIIQHCKQGATSHAASSQVLANCWQRPLHGLC